MLASFLLVLGFIFFPPLLLPLIDMATHSNILAWRIPWTEEPGGLVHGVTKGQTQLSN